MVMKKIISIIAPAFNEEEVIESFYHKITEVMKQITTYDYEIVISNDGSKDNTLNIIEEICKKDLRVKLVDLSRNYGHEIALFAGIFYSVGDALILMDVDLQDPPELIPELINKYEEGFEVVNARRISRDGETFLKKITAKIFYKIMAAANKKINIPENVGNYRLISRKVADSYKQLNEKHRFTRGLISWVGYKTCMVDFQRKARFAGKSKYHWNTMINFAIEGYTSFTTNPLRLASYFGLTLFFLDLIYFIILLIKITQKNITLDFRYHFLLMMICFFTSILSIFIGILGEYMGQIFDESKGRPLFFVQNLINIENK